MIDEPKIPKNEICFLFGLILLFLGNAATYGIANALMVVGIIILGAVLLRGFINMIND